jgi:integrase
MQRKTKRPVQFELTDQTRDSVSAWIAKAQLKPNEFLFPSRMRPSPHLSTRQYAKIVDSWVGSIGLDPNEYGTHTMRRTKATPIAERRVFVLFSFSLATQSSRVLCDISVLKSMMR